MKLILVPLVFAVFILCHVDETVGHRNSSRHHTTDRKELLKDILWHYLWLKDDSNNVRKDVGFLCSISNHKNLVANSEIKFDKVLKNDGDGYNGKTGVFTAPVTGLYHFHWYLLTYNSRSFDINLIHNGKRIIRSYTNHLSTHDSATNMVYLRVRKGEKVFLQTTSGGVRLHNDLYTTFGGELIRY